MKIYALYAAAIYALCATAHAAELKRKVGPITGHVEDLRSGRVISTCHRITFTDTDGKKYVREQDCPGAEGLGSIAYPADGCLSHAMCRGATHVKVVRDAHGVEKIILY